MMEIKFNTQMLTQIIMVGVIKVKSKRNNNKVVILIIMCSLVKTLWRKIRKQGLSIGWMTYNNAKDDMMISY